MPKPVRWSDQQVEEWIGNLLRAGVTLAATVVLIGGIVYLARHGMARPNYHVFRGTPSDMRSVHGILSDVRSLSGRAIIQLGLLLLIATPVARVLFSLFAFALQRDRLYVLFTLIVLIVLAYSLFWGKA